MISVFLIDDNIDLLEFLEEILVLNGYEIAGTARSGEEAVQKIRDMNPKPGIVLLDYRMPGKDGITTAKELLAMDPQCKIIMLTADDSVKELAFKTSIKGFIHKPCRFEVLEKQIKMLRL